MLLGLALCPAKKGMGQTPYDTDFINSASQFKEQLALFTDRSLYVVNEYVKFRADYFLHGPEQLEWSTVLYVEIVSASGASVSQGKFPIKKDLSMGSLAIPSETLSGNYYVKCYTRWMRNAGSEAFSFVPIKVINPGKRDLVVNHMGEAGESQVLSQDYRTGELHCSTDNSEYGRGEEVSLLISDTFDPIIDSLNCCVTVVQLGTVDTISGQLGASLESFEPESFRVNYLPDLGYGPAISGTVLRTNKRPAQYAMLHFSVLGEHPEVMAKAADAQGRFAFSTPIRFGKQEFFVSSSLKETAVLDVKIDQDFDNSPLRLPGFDFSLTRQERELLTRMSLNRQFSNAYSKPLKEVPDSSAIHRLPFYGSNAYGINLDDYVTLPTLEEVFINLVSNVNVVRKRGRPSLKILSEREDVGIFLPLILIDNIVVFDQEAVLALPASKIQRIDIINEIYTKGEAFFGGVIAIYSREGDMAGIDLPPGSYFFDYLSFQEEEPERYVSENPADQIPDSRNTIFWEPDVLVKAGDPVELNFPAPTLRGEYVVLLRARAPDGQVLSGTTTFTVE